MRGRRRAALLVYLLAASLLSPLSSAGQPRAVPHGMVVAQEPLAAGVGLQVLKGGGNAIDAAIAVGFALAVTHPVAGNLGGGGFMLIRMADGRTDFLDFRECAPKQASRDMYLDTAGKVTKDSIYGWRSSGVPGTVSGFSLAHEKFGSRPWRELVEPAVKLAGGFPVTEPFAASLANAEPLKHDPESQRVFLRGNKPYQTGETFEQPELCQTLKRLAANGARDFYEGETARRLVAAMAAHGGAITQADLRGYRTVERPPLQGAFRGYDIITAPPPSAGGIGLLQMLGMLDGTSFAEHGADSVEAIHFEAETMRRFYADRSEYLGDPVFYNVPVKQLLDPAYLAWRRSTIDPQRATPSEAVSPGLPHSVDARLNPQESPQTTHYNVIDSQGNAVAVTYTLNNSYGNGITVPGLGFLLNDEMDDFVAKPGEPNMYGLVGGEANAIEPGKRPVSSMTPAIITQGGKLVMSVGAPGGSRITNGVLQVIVDVLVFGMGAQQAVDLPRFHQQWKPDYLYLENGFPEKTREDLTKMGYDLRPIDGVARVEAIVQKDGVLQGGTQSRYHGKVASY